MRKPLGIVAWAALLSVVVFLFFDRATSNMRCITSPGNHLNNFETCLHKYQADPDSQKVALVGPSYVAQLGSLYNIHNLGIMTARPKEVASIVGKVSNSASTVLWPVTIRDYIYASDSARLHFTHAAPRSLTIIKSRLIVRPSKAQLPAPTPTELRSLISAVPSTSIGSDREVRVLLNQLKIIAAIEPDKINKHVFFEASQKHPNLIFVLFPVIPIQPSSGAEVSEYISRANENMIYFRDWFHESGLPFIDLSDTLSPVHFKNLCHYTDGGNAILRDALSTYALRT